jgi:hypothetical protein
VNNVIPQVELAWNTANAAYDVANTAVSTNIDTWARVQANAAFNKANTSIYKNITLVTTPGPIALANTTEVVFCDCNAASQDITVIFPTGPSIGQSVTIKNINAGAYDAFIQTTGSIAMELLNHSVGTGLYETLPQTGHTITWIWDGSAWRIINAFV